MKLLITITCNKYMIRQIDMLKTHASARLTKTFMLSWFFVIFVIAYSETDNIFGKFLNAQILQVMSRQTLMHLVTHK